MEIWVTGASGQIGRALIPQLLNEGHGVTALTHKTPLLLEGVNELHWAAARKPAFSSSLRTPNVIFHLAAQTSAYIARQNPPRDALTNVVGILQLLDFVRDIGGRPLVIHTGAVTETGEGDGTVSHDSPCKPSTFYDVGKVASRLYLEQYEREGWIDLVCFQLANVYGGQISDLSGDRAFINQSLMMAINKQPLTYFDHGEFLRDFIHVDDVVRALLISINKGRSLPRQTFPLGTGESTTIRRALQMISSTVSNHTGHTVPVRSIESPSGRYQVEWRNALVDSSAYTEQTGWSPELSFEAGLSLTLEKYFSLSTGDSLN